MSKIGRNEPCPCGSGKKYKKCCIDKPEQDIMREGFLQRLKSLWTYEKVSKMSTAEIIQRLESIGIPFDKDAFLRDIEKFYSAEQISENWFKNFRVTAKGRDEDFPWLAAWILWERLAPTHILSMEQMNDLIDEGFELLSKNDSKKACDVWLKVWEALKYRFKPEYKNLDFLDKQYNGSFFIRNFCQDLENELHNAALDDKTYFEKRINYCREFCDYFPDEHELIIHNMRRSIAESYSCMYNYEQAELEYKKLVQDYPDNPWGYIGWGDMYFFDMKKDYAKAKEFYEKALAIAKDKTDIIAVQERLEDLENETRI
ncbi:MAG: SEC-C domain-containing protein [Firmicutes bacterium]|nr:SEC-C domain-containing protein [Bacillota bacterium]